MTTSLKNYILLLERIGMGYTKVIMLVLPWCRDILVIESASRTEVPRFESRQGVGFLGLNTLQCCTILYFFIALSFLYLKKCFQKYFKELFKKLCWSQIGPYVKPFFPLWRMRKIASNENETRNNATGFVQELPSSDTSEQFWGRSNKA
jgi:hypothetical protein